MPGVDLGGGEPFLDKRLRREKPIKPINTAAVPRANAPCKKGAHLYGPAQSIGAGILRLVCEDCGAVSIDVREADLDLRMRARSNGG